VVKPGDIEAFLSTRIWVDDIVADRENQARGFAVGEAGGVLQSTVEPASRVPRPVFIGTKSGVIFGLSFLHRF